MTISAYLAALERPWLILPESLETVLSVLNREGDPEALAARLGRPLDNTRTVEVRENGVAVIPINGPIVRRANLFTEISGGTSTQVLATDIRAALDDPGVRALVLDIDSPGGEASGIHELAQMIYEARQLKPITAYVGATGASAAYWIASAASELVIDATARVGSIGVVTAFRRSDNANLVEIVSHHSPKKRLDPATDEGRAEVQQVVDELAQVFVDTVARNRGVTEDTVLADFGQGGVLVGASAVKAGMADRLGSLESVIAGLAGPVKSQPRGYRMSNENTPAKPVIVRTTAELQAVLEAGTEPGNIEIAAAPAVNVEAIRTESVQGERARIQGILELSAPGFEADIKAAIDEGASPEAAALKLIKATRDRGITLTQIQADATRAAHAPTPSGNPEDNERKGVISSIVSGAKRR